MDWTARLGVEGMKEDQLGCDCVPTGRDYDSLCWGEWQQLGEQYRSDRHLGMKNDSTG